MKEHGNPPRFLPYPEVVAFRKPPYCDCHEKEVGGLSIGACYCPEHNVIGLEGCYSAEDKKEIDKVALAVVVHETLHWIVGMFVGEQASFGLDSETIFGYLLESLEEDEGLKERWLKE